MNTKQDCTKGALGLFVTRNIGYNNYSYYYCSLTQQKYRIREEIKYSDFMKAISSVWRKGNRLGEGYKEIMYL